MIKDKSNLTIRQRMNLASWRIKTAHLKGEFGDHIQFGDTEEDIIKQKGIMSIPLSLLPSGKTPTFKFTEKKFDKDGLLMSASTPEERKDIEGTISLLTILEAEADRVMGITAEEEDRPVQNKAILSALTEESTEISKATAPVVETRKEVEDIGRVVDKNSGKSLLDADIEFLTAFLNGE